MLIDEIIFEKHLEEMKAPKSVNTQILTAIRTDNYSRLNHYCWYLIKNITNLYASENGNIYALFQYAHAKLEQLEPSRKPDDASLVSIFGS